MGENLLLWRRGTALGVPRSERSRALGVAITVDEEIILNRKSIFHTRNHIWILSIIPFPAHAAGGHVLLSTVTKGSKSTARGLGVLLTPPFVWFRDHILTIVSKFSGDGGVSSLVCLLPMMLVSKGYAWIGTHHVYTGSHFGLQRGDGRARYCKSLDVAVVGGTVPNEVDPDASHRPTGSTPLRSAQDDTEGSCAQK